jgi:hypothetical protein
MTATSKDKAEELVEVTRNGMNRQKEVLYRQPQQQQQQQYNPKSSQYSPTEMKSNKLTISIAGELAKLAKLKKGVINNRIRISIDEARFDKQRINSFTILN